jgi:hypothetical protein
LFPKTILTADIGADISSPMADMQAQNCGALCKRSQKFIFQIVKRTGKAKALKCCHPAGSWSARSHGLVDVGVGQGLGKINRFGRSVDHYRSHPHPHPTARKILRLLNPFEVRLHQVNFVIDSGEDNDFNGDR